MQASVMLKFLILILLVLPTILSIQSSPAQAFISQPTATKSSIPDPISVVRETRVYDIVSTATNHGKIQREPSLAVNPFKSGPNYNIIVGFNDRGTGNFGVGISHSDDGGNTWSTIGMPTAGLRSALCCDTGVAFTSNGTAIMVAQTFGSASAGTEIFTVRSGDGGATWSNPRDVVTGRPATLDLDRPAIAIDNGVNRLSSIAATNTVYVAWQRADLGNCEFISMSTNGGTNPWATPVQLCALSGATTGFSQEIAMGPSGEVYIAWQGNNGRHVICKSSAWPTFTCANPSTLVWSAFPPPLSVCGHTRPAIPNTCYRTNNQPRLAVDRSNNLYLVWQSFGPGTTVATGDGDIMVSMATGGNINTWSAPVQVNSDSTQGVNDGVDQFFPDVAVDPTTGGVMSVFYDRRGLTGRSQFNWFAAWSPSGGTSFPDQTPISSVPSNPLVSNNWIGLGDYEGAAVVAVPSVSKTFAAVWTDLRDGLASSTDLNSNIYFVLFGGSEFGGGIGNCNWVLIQWCIPGGGLGGGQLWPTPCAFANRPFLCPPPVIMCLPGPGNLTPACAPGTIGPHDPCQFDPTGCPYDISLEQLGPGPIEVSLSLKNLPGGVTGTISPTKLTSPSPITLNITSNGLKAGTYGFDIFANDTTGVNETLHVPFVVSAVPFLVPSHVFVNSSQTMGFWGMGFLPSSSVEVLLDNTHLLNATSNSRGDISGTLQLPQLTDGKHLLKALDSNGNVATASLTSPTPASEGDEKIGAPLTPTPSLTYAPLIGIVITLSAVIRSASLFQKVRRRRS